MSRVYDNWERLVAAVLDREDLKQLALCESFSSSTSTNFSSRLSFASTREDVSVAEDEEEKSSQEALSLPYRDRLSRPFLLAQRAIKSAQEAESFEPENAELARQVTQLSQLIRAAARLTTTTTYDRLIRRVSLEVTKTLESALTLARKCRRKKTNILHHVLSITPAADFKKVSALLDASLADIEWLLSIFNQDSDNYSIILSLPPIASSDPSLAWVWAHIAAVHMGRVQAAHELAILAGDNDRNKMIIVEENGVPPLLKMLKESGNLDAQSAAASALCSLADDKSCARMIAESSGVQVVARELSIAPLTVQIMLADLVSRMSEMDAYVREEFGRENVTRPLVSLLDMDVDLEKYKEANSREAGNSLHSLVMIDKEMMKKDIGGFGSGNSLEGSRHHRKQKEGETESPEVKLRLKVSCANALCKLSKGSLSNSMKITETKALRVLAKIIEKEEGELKMNCLMVVMELAAVAEFNTDLKRTVFRPSLTAAKVILDQLLRVINEDTSVPFVTPAIKAIGCLASVFPAKEKRIVQSLVTQLGHGNPNVATEAAIALGKFVCYENYNCKEHSRAIIEFNGVQKLTSFLRRNERGPSHLHEFALLCYLVINAGNSKAFEQTQTLSVLEGSAGHAVNQNPDLEELFAEAMHQLTAYQAVYIHIDRRAERD